MPSNGYVTWTSFLTVISITATLVVGIGWSAWQVHASQPHAGTVSEREYERLVTRLRNDLTDIRAATLRLEGKVDVLTDKILDLKLDKYNLSGYTTDPAVGHPSISTGRKP